MSITGGDIVDLGRGLYAWLPPKRGWGLANCGLLVSQRGALWIDTPYDTILAGQFLVESQKRLPDGAGIDRVIVTHANGDHFWGAGVLPDAEIIATREAREHLHYDPTPQQQHALVAGSDPSTPSARTSAAISESSTGRTPKRCGRRRTSAGNSN